MCILSTLQINHKNVTTATDILSYNTCGSLSMANCHLERALFLKAMIFLKGHMGTQCILQQIKSQTSGVPNGEREENGLFRDAIF